MKPMPGHLILVAEDDAVLRETLSETLRIEGYRGEAAEDGAWALSVVERLRPSVVLLDIQMPILDGRAFARELAERGLHVPIVVMTSPTNAEGAADEIDADGWVAKPFRLDE